MSRHIQRGDVIDHTAGSGGVTEGDVIAFNDGPDGIIGIALDTVAEGESVGCAIEGVVELPKQGGAGVTFDPGQTVYWDGTKAVESATGNTPAGRAVAAAADAATVVQVKLNWSAKPGVAA